MVRTSAAERDALEKELTGTAKGENSDAEEVGIELYRHAAVETDLTLQLHHSSKIDPSGSELGRRLANSLSEYGRVRHTVWLRCEEDVGGG